MILRYKGYWVKTDKEKMKKLSLSEKLSAFKEYFSEENKYIVKKIKDYWIGYVDVHTQDIFVCDDENRSGHNELYEISIIAGKHGRGQWFSHIGKNIVEQLVNDWEFSEKKEFELHLDLGCGAYQRYTFSKKQKDMLIEKLKPLIEKKWYENNGEEW